MSVRKALGYYIHIGVGSKVVCSTTIGNARASIRGMDNCDSTKSSFLEQMESIGSTSLHALSTPPLTQTQSLQSVNVSVPELRRSSMSTSGFQPLRTSKPSSQRSATVTQRSSHIAASVSLLLRSHSSTLSPMTKSMRLPNLLKRLQLSRWSSRRPSAPLTVATLNTSTRPVSGE